ncbi:hypothetical protein RvY_06250 [Ramazzottius varieornatus]|uniref:Uncharacterized protein n=1 Tax=Ramazzottius varieornatus TaxID=947166 RepID=A0A1D1V0W0_RAMVA|nr:hypothetical protein RvY_06250 [Ramazzottius varieornatus]
MNLPTGNGTLDKNAAKAVALGCTVLRDNETAADEHFLPLTTCAQGRAARTKLALSTAPYQEARTCALPKHKLVESMAKPDTSAERVYGLA